MGIEIKPYDSADYLTTDEDIVAYLEEGAESNDPRIIAKSLATVARAKGSLDHLAEASGLAPEDLNRALGEDGNPDLATLLKIVQALGVKLSFTAAA